MARRSRLTAFGLDVQSDVPLIFLGGAPQEPTGRPLTIAAQNVGVHELAWPELAEVVCDERAPSGEVIFRIEAHPEAGYLISGPRYGAFLVSADGTRVLCAAEGHPDHVWQRLLISQVMPFASLLQGLEVFHASAVVRNGEGVAFLGRSHAGKTSLALAMCRRGTVFLADDVLALETTGEQLIAHPGTRLAGVAHTAEEPHFPLGGMAKRSSRSTTESSSCECPGAGDQFHSRHCSSLSAMALDMEASASKLLPIRRCYSPRPSTSYLLLQSVYATSLTSVRWQPTNMSSESSWGRMSTPRSLP